MKEKPFKQLLERGRQWQCNNICKGDCCSEVFLALSPVQKTLFEKQGYIKANKNYTDFKWLGYHYGINISDDFKITFTNTETDILFCDTLDKHVLRADTKCKYLLQNSRCAIFRRRPLICRVAKCPVFENESYVKWVGENSKYMKRK